GAHRPGPRPPAYPQYPAHALHQFQPQDHGRRASLPERPEQPRRTGTQRDGPDGRWLPAAGGAEEAQETVLALQGLLRQAPQTAWRAGEPGELPPRPPHRYGGQAGGPVLAEQAPGTQRLRREPQRGLPPPHRQDERAGVPLPPRPDDR